MIHLEERYLEIVKNILDKYPYKFYIYGSRIKGTHRPTSDLDICFMDKIPLKIQGEIEERFDESDLPFIVEVCDFNLMSKEFQEIIKRDLTPI